MAMATCDCAVNDCGAIHHLPGCLMAPATSKYLAIVRWARHRYSKDGRIATFVGGQPSPFTRIEDAAAAKYLGCERRFA
jgi:hypothetical protein